MQTTKNSKTVGLSLPRGAWKVVILLFFVSILNYLDRSMIITMHASIIKAMPMTDAQFGLLTSVFLWVYGALSPFAGFLADRFSRSKVIIGSLFVWSAATLLTAHAVNFEQLLATRVLMGVSEACYIPASLALIMDYHQGRTRSTASGINMAGIMAGSSLGFAGGWLAEKYHWSTAFSVFGIAGIAYSLLLVFMLRDLPVMDNKDTAGPGIKKANFLLGLKNLFSNRSFILLLLFWGLLGIVGWLVMGWLPVYYQEHFRLPQSLAGLYATGYIYPVALVGLLFGGFIADRWSRRNPNARIWVTVIGLLIATPFIFLASSTAVLPLAIACFMVYAFTMNFSNANLMPILCMVSDAKYRATGYGVLNFFSTIIGGCALYGAGVLKDAHIELGWIYRSAALIMLVCAVLLAMVRSRSPSKLSNP